jgi:hypothetical protein
MSANHTPGPWRAENGIIKFITHGKWFTVARIDKPRFTQEGIEANSRLIACAPELLEALQQIEAQLSEHPEANTGNSKVHFAMHKARAAISKAKGQA